MQKKRVGFLITSSSWTNFQRWHYYTALALSERGYDVVIITPRKNRIYSKTKNKNITVVPYQQTGILLFDILKLSKILRKNFINTLFLNYPKDIKVAGFTKVFSRVGKVYFRKGTASEIKLNWLNKLIFRKYISGIITNSKANKEEILSEKPKTAKIPNVEVIYQGLHLERYKKINGQKRQNRNGEVLKIGIYNGFRYQEDYCIEILKHLRKDFNTDKINFLLYQDSFSPGFRQNLKKNEFHNLLTIDVVDKNFKDFLSSVDVFFSTMNLNAFNYSLIYAMVMGKPVIALNEGSNNEIIEHGKNGYLVDKNNIKALGNVIEKLKDEERLEEMGKESMKIVKEKFNFEQSVDHIEAIL
ncbi:MAG: glycosyltransferase [Bacteroidales bacterium]